jgi:hypothetical protein
LTIKQWLKPSKNNRTQGELFGIATNPMVPEVNGHIKCMHWDGNTSTIRRIQKTPGGFRQRKDRFKQELQMWVVDR